MPAYIFVRLDRLPAQNEMIRWLNPADQSGLTEGTVEQLAAVAKGHPLAVVIPGEAVLTLNARLPTQSRAKLLRAVPYAVEDQLAADVDELHFALGERQGDGVQVGVVSHDKMRQIGEVFATHGLEPEIVAPDYLLVPYEEGAWQIWHEDGRILLRTGLHDGAALEAENFAQYLKLVLAEVDDEHRPAKIMVYEAQPHDWAWLEEICVPLEIPVERREHQGHLLALAASGFTEGQTLNLLQGDYSRREQLGRMWRPWIPAAAIFGGLIVIQLLTMGVDYFRLQSEYNRLSDEVKQVYLNTFPDAQKVVNARVQMEQRLTKVRSAREQGGDLYLGLLESFSQIYANGLRPELERLRFQDEALTVDMTLDSLGALDNLKAQLAKDQNIQAEVVSADTKGDKVMARVQMKRVGG
ncbi:MAG: type II secretion system protein GspL [Pseudomonadota bacterium]